MSHPGCLVFCVMVSRTNHDRDEESSPHAVDKILQIKVSDLSEISNTGTG